MLETVPLWQQISDPARWDEADPDLMLEALDALIALDDQQFEATVKHYGRDRKFFEKLRDTIRWYKKGLEAE